MKHKRGRKPTIGAVILSKAQECRTVAELVQATGAKPQTVRSVLRKASDRGEIVLRRFIQGKSGRAIRVAPAFPSGGQRRAPTQQLDQNRDPAWSLFLGSYQTGEEK